MSALGQKRTCAVQKGMSALPLKADMLTKKGGRAGDEHRGRQLTRERSQSPRYGQVPNCFRHCSRKRSRAAMQRSRFSRMNGSSSCGGHPSQTAIHSTAFNSFSINSSSLTRVSRMTCSSDFPLPSMCTCTSALMTERPCRPCRAWRLKSNSVRHCRATLWWCHCSAIGCQNE